LSPYATLCILNIRIHPEIERKIVTRSFFHQLVCPEDAPGQIFTKFAVECGDCLLDIIKMTDLGNMSL